MITRLLQSARRNPLPMLALVGLGSGLTVSALIGEQTGQAILLGTLLLAGAPVVYGTVRGMLRGIFASDIVASLAIIGAAVTGEYFAGCVIVLMQTGGEALEAFATRRASASLEALLSRRPHLGHRRRGETIEDIPVDDITVGDVLLVRPGETIPVDGTVVSGVSALDESALTGEPAPVTAGPGSEVMSGSICADGALEVRAIRPSSESQYEQIVRLVRAAEEDKAPIGRLADRYAVFFTPLTLALCALAYLLTRRPEAVVAVLVVATPCPLILATPVAIISGINRAAKKGIIVKGGAPIEQLGEARAVVFDKTGTLTVGAPVVERIVPLDGYPDGTVLRLAAGLEQLSGHPMAQALASLGRTEMGDLPVPSDVTEMAGQGVTGRVEGHTVDVGSIAYASSKGLAAKDQLVESRRLAGADERVTALVGIDGRPAGLVVYTDPVRPAAFETLRRLRDLGVRETAMLTGDDETTANAVAAEIELSDVKADLLPGQKVDAVKELMQRYHSVVMVGDGINDAPALATATVGIALGAHGAVVSAQAADVVVTTDELSRIADAIEIGKRTLRIAKESIWVGLGLSCAMMVVAALGYIPPAIGAVLQEILDFGVIVNALRAR